MSFILDALKKSENDRQRQSGPALFEVKVAPPRTGLPLWAIAIVVLLGINLVIVAWMVFRHPTQQQAATTPANTAPVGVPASGTAAPPASFGPPQPPVSAPSQQQFAQSPTGPGVPPAQQSGYPSQPGDMSQQQGSVRMIPQPAAGSAGSDSQQMSGATARAGGANGGDASGERLNPDDYEPATEPGAPAAFNGRVKRNTDSGLPLYQDAAATPGASLPQLRLDLHVFAAKPQERFVMINMRKLREGDSLPEGVRVESITPEGAVLSRNGSRFLLPRD